ncbi:MAG TPA: ATP-binding cassette domain-containing protein [Anaerolineae bacterium]|nr:ATP-binding cassette domain-containing protein [Anaerolineae bacterium]
MPEAEIVVQARNLTKRFGAFTAVRGIGFEVYARECFGFLGPNGASKTTTTRMIYGFSPLTEGKLRVLGLDVQRDIRRSRPEPMWLTYKEGWC